MISLQNRFGLGLEIIGVQSGFPEKGLIVDDGLFARFSIGVTKLTALKSGNFANFIAGNAVPYLQR